MRSLALKKSGPELRLCSTGSIISTSLPSVVARSERGSILCFHTYCNSCSIVCLLVRIATKVIKVGHSAKQNTNFLQLFRVFFLFLSSFPLFLPYFRWFVG